MAQEWDEKSQSQEMKQVIGLLKKFNIDFRVEGNKIMVKGDVVYVDILSMPGIIITQRDKKIGFDMFDSTNNLVVRTSTRAEVVKLSKEVYADYNYPYLIIHF